ncbi:hypothetical protein ACH5RR_034274 [Cinchona calisaya]|uniref:Replication protein A 70 kDa DNA-binding subunit B/D first OB fold domain-containing protein n=1 Tax=Cinchona calisaya TaxID=153742 RepID=A0ABD2YAD8_9GENT
MEDKILRHISSVLEIQKGIRGWTVLVQVIERGHVHNAQGNQTKKLRQFLLIDSKGTKVSAILYDNYIRFFFNMLRAFKRYFISNTSLSKTLAANRVGDYPLTWIINSTTLVEPYPEPMPLTLPCTFDLACFNELLVANTNILQSKFIFRIYSTLQLINSTL